MKIAMTKNSALLLLGMLMLVPMREASAFNSVRKQKSAVLFSLTAKSGQFTGFSHQLLAQSLARTKLVVLAEITVFGNLKTGEEKGLVYYRKAGSSADTPYQTTPFSHIEKVGVSQTNSQLTVYQISAQIPKDFMTAPGVEYYIKAYDGKNYFSYRTADSPQVIAVKEQICTSKTLSAAPGSQSFVSPVMVGNAPMISLNAIQSASGKKISIPLEFCANSPDLMPAFMRPAPSGEILDPQPVMYLDLSPEHTQFARPVELVLSYTDFDNDGIVDDTRIPAKSLKLFWWDNFAWRSIGGVVDEQKRTVTVKLSHFSSYALFSSNAVPSYRPKEKIITPATLDGYNDFANFDGLSGKQFTIRIFDITGRVIRTITESTIWDGKNDFGQVVENGAYIYQVSIEGKIVSGVIAVAK